MAEIDFLEEILADARTPSTIHIDADDFGQLLDIVRAAAAYRNMEGVRENAIRTLRTDKYAEIDEQIEKARGNLDSCLIDMGL